MAPAEMAYCAGVGDDAGGRYHRELAAKSKGRE
jgi:hypothetical protein